MSEGMNKWMSEWPYTLWHSEQVPGYMSTSHQEASTPAKKLKQGCEELLTEMNEEGEEHLWIYSKLCETSTQFIKPSL